MPPVVQPVTKTTGAIRQKEIKGEIERHDVRYATKSIASTVGCYTYRAVDESCIDKALVIPNGILG